MSVQREIKLNNGRVIPSLGLGTANSLPGEVENAIRVALCNGYSHIDCAAYYGNEKEVGQGIKSSGVERSKFFVTSKLWNSHWRHVREACESTLKDLQLEYLDLYLIHWPLPFEFNGLDLSVPNSGFKQNNDPSVPFKVVLDRGIGIREVWTEMEKLVDAGLVKSIGVSNFNVPIIRDLLTYARIKPVVNQVELSPHFSQESLVQFQKHYADIVTVAYSPFGQGHSQGPLAEPTIKNLAEKYQKSPAQIIIRWNLQRGIVVIPKSVTAERIISNADVFDFELSNEDVEQINSLNKNHRYIRLLEEFGVDTFV